MQSFERYAKYYDLINKDKPYKQEIEFVYEWAKRPKEFIDLGCGTAKYWKYFPVLPVAGIEKSPEMVALSPYCERIICADILDMQKPSNPSFDCAVDCVFALFDVMNYLPNHRWWRHLPLKKGGYFIFDIWDIGKANRQGFQRTVRRVKDIKRTITPCRRGNNVLLEVVLKTPEGRIKENHTMSLYSRLDIISFCEDNFKISEVRMTNTWQTWYKLEKL